MFDGLSGMDWLFIAAALALGFGVVKFLLVAKPDQNAAVPSKTPDVQSQARQEAVPPESNGRSDKQMSADGSWELPRIDASPIEQVSDHAGGQSPTRLAWFDLLDLPRTASAFEIEQAFDRKWAPFTSGRLTSLMADLSVISNGGLEQSMPKQLEVQSMRAALLADQLKSLLSKLLHDMETARHEGLVRRSQGHMD